MSELTDILGVRKGHYLYLVSYQSQAANGTDGHPGYAGAGGHRRRSCEPRLILPTVATTLATVNQWSSKGYEEGPNHPWTHCSRKRGDG